MAFFEHYGGDWWVFKVVPPPPVKYDLMAEVAALYAVIASWAKRSFYQGTEFIDDSS